MGDAKQVKVDNWGTFFLQRLKHFFNRTDYCDLTLQFQDNAQLKVHRLVLNACTEYFELLERTCEMYEDCLIMPDDLQADVVVPIVNFMYTGQLEYKYDLLDRLYQTAQIMNMSVLTKLLDAHRNQPPPPRPAPKKYRQSNYSRPVRAVPSTSQQKIQQKKVYVPAPKQASTPKVPTRYVSKPQARQWRTEPVARPTRYELPEELDKDDLFESSFTDISYESKPLMIHPLREEKECASYEPSSSKKFEDLRKIMKRPSTSTADLVEFKRLKTNQNNSIFEGDDFMQSDEGDDLFDIRSGQTSQVHDNSNHLYDHVIETQGAKVTIETKTNENSSIDHAKIISEVLKKYPHLVKNNKNIKLKIVNTPTKTESKSTVRRLSSQAKRSASPSTTLDIKPFRNEDSDRDFTYETDVTDPKEMGRLIALGVDNVKGPWLCLICGTPGKALNFCSYHKFRNHLVEVHNERPSANMCEFCGLRSGKRNHLLHHIYTKHGVPPPPSYHFPKCNQCNYIALTQAFLIKHKMTHTDTRSFNCNVCQASFKSTSLLLQHIQQTGHKICPDRKANLQCIYCMKVFLRESNLYAHLKTAHKSLAREDGIIDNSDEDDDLSDLQQKINTGRSPDHHQQKIKSEPISREELSQPTPHTDDEDEDESQYQIHQHSDGKIQILNKKVNKSPNQKILNQSLSPSSSFDKQTRKSESPKKKLPSMKNFQNIEPELTEEYNERIVVLNQNEYLLKGKETPIVTPPMQNEEYILSEMMEQDADETSENISVSLPEVALSSQLEVDREKPKIINKNPSTVSQPYQIVVSNEAEYKALMVANPSILFQDGIQNKELSVLEHNSSLTSENIPLDPSQNNDMMIIQDDYPLNVSEAITTNNSNIVVVYSHPIDSTGKQFVEYAHQPILQDSDDQNQILQTTQVLPSITTTTPIIGDGMLIQHTIDPWQSEDQHPVGTSVVEEDPNVISHVTVQDQSEEVQSEVQVTTSPNIVDKGLGQLAELQILSQSEEGIITEEVTSQPTDIQHQHVQELDVSESRNKCNSENVLEQDESASRELSDRLDVEDRESEVTVPDQSFNEMEIENSNVVVELVQTVNQESITSLEEESTTMEVQQNEEVMETNLESESSQDLTENETEVLVENASTLGVVNEQIQSLAAEWSDEESTPKITDDSVENPGNITTETDSSLPTDGIPIQDTSEVEESVENIQQEMENQLTAKVVPAKSRIIITSDITLTNPSPSISSISHATTPSEHIASEQKDVEETKASKTNISSLLNDWDDNDSQIESNGANTPQKTTQNASVDPDVIKTKIVEAVVPLQEEKLKGLDKIMSDWDEDDEKEK